jgi:hypothetical protein
LEELGQADLLHLFLAGRQGFENIILTDFAAEWQLPSLSRDGLDLPAKLDLGLEQAVAGTAVLRGLAGKLRVATGFDCCHGSSWAESSLSN